jgi:hypothetical protein
MSASCHGRSRFSAAHCVPVVIVGDNQTSRAEAREMEIINWAMGLISQWVTWRTRCRNLSIALLDIIAMMFIALAGGLTIETVGVVGFIKVFKFLTGEGLPGHLLSLSR